MPTMKPWLSVARWIFVVKPPRDRPNAWSAGSCICADFGPPSRRGSLAPFSGPGRRTAGPDDGGIDTPEVVIDLTSVIEFVQERGDDPDPGAIRPPAVEALIDRLPGAIALRQVAPRGAGMEDPQDAVDDGTGITEGTTGPTAMRPVRQEGSDPSPLRLGEFIASHGRTRWGNGLVPGLMTIIIIFLEAIASES